MSRKRFRLFFMVLAVAYKKTELAVQMDYK